MSTWMFYSYKGGSGRTVASANIAAALAKLGKRVLIIDMDIEAPGLHTLFRVENTDKFQSKGGIQDYLKGDLKVEDVLTHMIIDLASEDGLIEPYPIPDDARFLYLMASTRSSVVFTGESDLNSKMTDLVDFLKKSEKLDYIILDAASGIREAFTLSLHVCDNIMIFFRWSRQHLEGTIKVVQLLNVMKEMEGGAGPSFKLVASAAPGDIDLERLENQTLAGALRGVKNEGINRLRRECGQELFAETPEIIELKWQESVIVFNQDNTAYELIAEKILAQ